jgi:hypothetical protein
MGVGVIDTPRPLYPRERQVPIVQEAGWAPGPVWTGTENLAPSPGFDPRTVQPVPTEISRPTTLADSFYKLAFTSLRCVVERSFVGWMCGGFSF